MFPQKTGLPRPRFDRSFLLLPLLALLPIPLWILFGYGGQDFDFHIPSWLELHAAWQAHEWRLGWAASAQYGYGEPRFCFYPPLSFLVGGLLSFVVPLRLLPGAVAWLALFAAAASMWVAWGRLVGERHRLLASVAYMWNWYLLSCVVIRYAIAEVWVLAMLPLLFLFFYIGTVEARPKAVPGLALFLALAWLTNIPGSIVLFYSLGCTAVVVAWQRRSAKPLVLFALAEAGALGASAFRLLPALAESKLIQTQGLLHTLDFRNSLLFRHIPPPHAFIYFMDCSAVLLGFLLLAAFWRQRQPNALRLSPFITFLFLMLFFEEPLSIPVWRVLPQLAYVAFAFRFLGLFSLAAVFLVIGLRGSKRFRSAVVVLMISFSLYPFFFFSHNLFSFEHFPDLQTARNRWMQGYEGMHEYVPATAPPSAVSFDAARPQMRKPLFASGECPIRLRLQLEARHPVPSLSTCLPIPTGERKRITAAGRLQFRPIQAG